MISKVLVSFLFLSSFALGELRSEVSKILGGQEVEIESVPYFVSIIRYEKHLCGGAIISRTFVLTAAQCLQVYLPSSIQIRAGSTRASQTGNVYNASDYYVHPDWNFVTNEYDFLLVKIKGSIALNDRQQPIKLPSDSNLGVGNKILTLGFGQTKSLTQDSETLRAVVLDIKDPQSCIEAYSEGYKKVTSNKFCVGSESDNQMPCEGDFGGPAEKLGTGELVGIFTFGPDCGDISKPGVFGLVSSVRPWIKQIAKV